MANKREFKKNVESVGAIICEPMFDAYHTLGEKNQEAIGQIIEKVLSAVAAARSNADTTFDKGVKAFDNLKDYSLAKKDFYKKLFAKIYNDFTNEVNEALKEFNAILPQEIKEANKEAAKK